MKAIGKDLKEARLKKGLTGEQLAELLSVTEQTVSQWEADESFPDIEALIKLSDILDLDLDELLKENSADTITDFAARPQEEPQTEYEAPPAVYAPEPESVEVIAERSKGIQMLLLVSLIFIFLLISFLIYGICFAPRKAELKNLDFLYIILLITAIGAMIFSYVKHKNTPKNAIIRCGDELRVYYGKHFRQVPLNEIDYIREFHPRSDYFLHYGALHIVLKNGEKLKTVTLKGDIAEIRTRILEAKHLFEQADGGDAYGAPEQEYEEYDESDEYAEDGESEEYSENNENKE